LRRREKESLLPVPDAAVEAGCLVEAGLPVAGELAGTGPVCTVGAIRAQFVLEPLIGPPSSIGYRPTGGCRDDTESLAPALSASVPVEGSLR